MKQRTTTGVLLTILERLFRASGAGLQTAPFDVLPQTPLSVYLLAPPSEFCVPAYALSKQELRESFFPSNSTPSWLINHQVLDGCTFAVTVPIQDTANNLLTCPCRAEFLNLSTSDTWDWIIPCCGTVVCIGGCRTTSLASTH